MKIKIGYPAAVAVTLVLSLLLGFTAHAQQADRPAADQVIRDFFDAYHRKDIGLLGSLWLKESAESQHPKRAFARILESTGPIDPKSVQITAIEMRGPDAVVRVAVRSRTIDKTPGQEITDADQLNCVFELKQQDGEWKVRLYRTEEEELAGKIAAASNQERKSILEAASTSNHSLRLCRAMLREGRSLIDHGSYPQAIAVLETARNIADERSAKVESAWALLGIGDTQYSLGNLQKAKEAYQTGFSAAEAGGDAKSKAYALIGLGQVSRVTAGLDEALEFYTRSLKLAESISDKWSIAHALENIGFVWSMQSKLQEAGDYLGRSRQIYEEIEDNLGIGRVMTTMAVISSFPGDYEKALSQYRDALHFFESEGARLLIAQANTSIGSVLQIMGDEAAAAESIRKAVTVMREIGARRSLAITLIQLGICDYQKADYQASLRDFDESLRLLREMSDLRNQASALQGFGIVYNRQGDPRKALDYYERTRDIYIQLQDKAGLMLVSRNIGLNYEDMGQLSNALEHMSKSTSLAKELGVAFDIALGMQGMAEIHRMMGRYDEAIAELLRSLSILEKSGNPEGVTLALMRMGDVYKSQGALAKTAEVSARAASIATKHGFISFELQASTAAGEAYKELKQTELAREYFSRAIEAIEGARGQVAGGESERQGFLESNVTPYYEISDLLVGKAEYPDAFAFVERAKARTLLDVLQSGKVNISKAMTAEERLSEQRIKEHLASLNSEVLKERLKAEPDEKRLSELATALDKARRDFEEFQAVLYAKHQELRSQRGEFQPISLAECGTLIPDSKTALLEYAVLEDRTYLFVFSRAAGGPETAGLKVFEIDVKKKDLMELTDRFRRSLGDRNLGYDDAAKKLYSLLLTPAAAQLRGKRSVVIVPDGPLWQMPFQALESTGGRFVIEDYALSYAPSLTALREMSSAKPKVPGHESTQETLLAMGNPEIASETRASVKQVLMDETLEPLPEAEKQVNILGGMYGSSNSKIYTGSDATEERLKAEAGKCRILELATHGIINDANPMYSQIVLARGTNSDDDGLLEAWEIMNLDLSADLAVLSACETARGQVRPGEGMIGLSWAMFVAGCPTTVVSQWKVESESTTALMVDFHRNLLAGKNKAQALREAELKLLKDPKYRHPFYWAPFVIVGNPN